jgi:hypothetical protein
MTFSVSCKTWLSALVLGRVVLPRPEPTFGGTLLVGSGGLAVENVDLKELMGMAAEPGFGSGAEWGTGTEWGAGVVAVSLSPRGGLAAAVGCSLATSARGVRGARGCFGVEKAGAFATPLGAGRVYTMPCQPGRGNTPGCRPTLREKATVPIDHVLAQVPAISEFVVALEQFYAVALRKA